MAGLQGGVIGGYQLTDQLSSGGVAEVYRARPTQPGGREAVVKVIYPEFARQPGFRARFDQVVQMASRLDHPHILPLLGSGEQTGYLYLITPFVAAGNLRDWIQSGRRLGTHDVGPFFRQVCEATTYAHSQSVIHGNIKPSNIFLFEGRHVLLGDFGRLWDVGQMDMTHAGPGIEAVEFLAPEVIEGHVDQRSDIYSLGAVLFASLTGAPPFRGTTPFEVLGQHARQAPSHLANIAPPLPAGIIPLDAVVQRALAKAPEGRFPSAVALAQAIEAALHGGTQSATSGGFAGANAASAASPFATAPRPEGPLGRASFPPLPASALVDPTMEEGRFAASPPFPTQSPNSGPGAKLPTTALPNQPGVPGFFPSPSGGTPGGREVMSQPTQRVPASGGVGGIDLPSQPTAHVPAPPLGLPGSQYAGAYGPGGSDPSFGLSSGAPPASPFGQVRTPPEPSAAGHQPGGFVVAGGASSWGSAASDLEQANPLDFGAPRIGSEAGARADGVSLYTGADGGFGPLAEIPAPVAGDDRPFSATRLGLPRLTTPELSGLPPSWRDIASGIIDATERSAPSDPLTGWSETGPWSRSFGEGAFGEAPPRGGDDSDHWGESAVDNRAYAAQDPWSTSSVQVGAAPDIYASSSLPAVGGGRWGRSGVRQADAEDEDPSTRSDPFADPSAWARPSDGRRLWRAGDKLPRGRELRIRTPRRMGPLLLFVAFLVVIDGALIVAVRPDLCPQRACASVHAKLTHYLPILAVTQAAPTAAPLTTSPTHVSLAVAAGSASTVDVTLTGSAHQPVSWSAKSSLAWLAVDPVTAQVPAGGTGHVHLKASPATSVHPGTYPATVVFTVGTATVSVPVAITVTARSR